MTTSSSSSFTRLKESNKNLNRQSNPQSNDILKTMLIKPGRIWLSRNKSSYCIKDTTAPTHSQNKSITAQMKEDTQKQHQKLQEKQKKIMRNLPIAITNNKKVTRSTSRDQQLNSGWTNSDRKYLLRSASPSVKTVNTSSTSINDILAKQQSVRASRDKVHITNDYNKYNNHPKQRSQSVPIINRSTSISYSNLPSTSSKVNANKINCDQFLKSLVVTNVDDINGIKRNDIIISSVEKKSYRNIASNVGGSINKTYSSIHYNNYKGICDPSSLSSSSSSASYQNKSVNNTNIIRNDIKNKKTNDKVMIISKKTSIRPENTQIRNDKFRSYQVLHQMLASNDHK